VTRVSTAFLLTTLVIVATPGTGVLYTLSAGLSRGTRAALVAAFGATLGILPHVAAAITGLAALLHASGVAFEVLRYLGVAYLLYMAISTVRDERPLHVARAEPAPPSRVIASGVLVNLLNPKLTLFFVAFLPQFAHGTAGMLALSGVFMAVTLVVFAAYGALAAAVRDHVVARPRVTIWMRRVFGGAFAGLACRLALSDR
jgi:threonine/homoserine/homoserine lactone efflux protein